MTMKKESTKEKLLKVASALFSQKSFSDLTTREIANKAKVNLSAIKYYFSSKENLFIETLTLLLQDIKEKNIDYLQFEGEISQEEAISKFKSFVKNLNSLMSLPRTVHPFKIMLREVLAINKKNKKMCEIMIDIITNEFMKPFEEKGVRLIGFIAPHLSNEDKVNAINAVCSMCSHYLIAGDFIKSMRGINISDGDTLDKFSDFITNFTLKGLGIN